MNNRIKLLTAAMLTAAFLPVSGALAGDIDIENPWARASAGPAKAGAAFMEINNAGAADRVTGVSADISETVELHTHIRDGDVMRMREVEFIDVPANGATELKPGGLHVMFMGLKAPLKEGETFPLTLTFENAGDVTVEVNVMKASAMGATHGEGHGHGHGEGHGDIKKQ